MTAKTIQTKITAKIDDWLASIEDEDVRKEVSKSVLVTGGAITSMLNDNYPNDFDVYFDSKKAAELCALYYINKYDSLTGIEMGYPGEWKAQEGKNTQDKGRVYLNIAEGSRKLSDERNEDLPAYTPVFVTNNAMTLTGKIQLIFRFIGKPSKIHENYDFVHCTNYWYKGELHFNKEALLSIATKELKYIGSKYPITSMVRTRKFIQRGFTINAGELFKIAWQISELDLYDVATLREQLVGVDVYYFDEMISRLKDMNSEGNAINQTTIFKLIDELFDYNPNS